MCHFFTLIACPSCPTICEIMALQQQGKFGYVYKKNRVLQVSVKKSITLNYLIFLILYEYKKFSSLDFQKLVNFGFVLQSNQKANHSQMYKKMTMFKKILCPKSIHYKSLLACPKGPTIQAVSVKWHPRTFVPKIYLQFGKVFKHL